MSKRCEPVQSKQGLHGNIDQKIVGTVMRKLVVDRKVARQPIRLRHKTLRHSDNFIEHAESQWCGSVRRLKQANFARPTDFARAIEQFAAQLEIGGEPNVKENGGTHEPSRNAKFKPWQRGKRQSR